MTRNTPSNSCFYRAFELDRATLNKDGRTVEVSFSSEQPVRRWFGSEILLHGAENVNLSRLKSMGAALMNHDPRIIIGRITGPKVQDKRGTATIVFDDDDEGNRAMRKVESGSLRGVSVGYQIEKFREVMRDEEWEGIKGPAFVATRWTPIEISLTPVPADHTVGVGRDATRSLDGIEIEREVGKMEEKDVRKIVEDELKATVPEIVKQVRAGIAEDAAPKMRVSPEEYQGLLSRASAISPEAVNQFAGWVAEGRTANEIKDKLLDLKTGQADSRNAGGSSPDDTGRQQTSGADPVPKNLKEMDDDAFMRALTQPTLKM